MSRFFTRERVVQSLVDGLLVGVAIFSLDVFLSKKPVAYGLEFGLVFGVVAFLLRVVTRPNRPAPGVRP